MLEVIKQIINQRKAKQDVVLVGIMEASGSIPRKKRAAVTRRIITGRTESRAGPEAGVLHKNPPQPPARSCSPVKTSAHRTAGTAAFWRGFIRSRNPGRCVSSGYSSYSHSHKAGIFLYKAMEHAVIIRAHAAFIIWVTWLLLLRMDSFSVLKIRMVHFKIIWNILP